MIDSANKSSVFINSPGKKIQVVDKKNISPRLAKPLMHNLPLLMPFYGMPNEPVKVGEPDAATLAFTALRNKNGISPEIPFLCVMN